MYLVKPTCDDRHFGENISGDINDTICAMSGGTEELMWVFPSAIFTSTLVTVFWPSADVQPIAPQYMNKQ